MKRRILALLLAVLTLTMLTAAAFAADTPVYGVYNVKGPLTVKNGTQDGSFYQGADTFELNCTGLTGEYSLVLLLAGTGTIPTSENIQYIDQMNVTGGTATFTLKPRALTPGTYIIYVSTSDTALKQLASFEYGEKPPYTLGDVDGDGYIDSIDALMVLQHAAKLEGHILSGSAFSAADVNNDGTADSIDALLILQYAAKLIDEF